MVRARILQIGIHHIFLSKFVLVMINIKNLGLTQLL